MTAFNYGVLGNTADASTEVSLYTVPTTTDAKLRVVVANRAGTAATFRIALVPDGGATANEDYLAFDTAIGANATLVTETLTANDSDVLRVEASTATVSFTAYGIEQTTV